MAEREKLMIRGELPNDDHNGFIYCEACKEMRPSFEYTDLEYQVGGGGIHGPAADVPIVVCKRCKTVGPPKIDPTSALTLPHARALEALSKGLDIPEAARYAGMKSTALRRLLQEQERSPLRVAWQHVLNSKGITLDKLGDTLADALEAMEHKYNPKLEGFESFRDDRTRLAAVRTAATFHRLDPPKEIADKNSMQAIQVNVHTTLGQDTGESRVAGGYSVTVTKGKDKDADDG